MFLNVLDCALCCSIEDPFFTEDSVFFLMYVFYANIVDSRFLL